MKKVKKPVKIAAPIQDCRPDPPVPPRPRGAMPFIPPTQPLSGVTLGPNSILRDLLEGRMLPDMIRML